MVGISRWAVTAAGNALSSPDGFPEGMAPSGLNDSAREMMAQIRTAYNDIEWIKYGKGGASSAVYTITYSSATSFRVEGVDLTAEYCAGRRVKAVGSTTGTIYGVISTVTYSAHTAITAVWDNGSLANETLSFWISAIRPNLKSLPVKELGSFSFRNLLENAEGLIAQRGTSVSTADDVYGLDRWYALTQTAAATMSQLVNDINGIPSAIRLTQPAAGAQRIGAAQILTGSRSALLRGSPSVLSGKIKCSSSQAIRYAILEWTGTAGVVTSDVVNDWTSGTYTAGNFFSGTTLTVAGVGSVTPGAGVWTDIPNLTATISSSCNNIVIFYWTEGTAAQNVTLDARLQFEKGSAPTSFEFRPYQVELSLCQRYLVAFTGAGIKANGWTTSSTQGAVIFTLPVFLLSPPTGVTITNATNMLVYFPASSTSLVSATVTSLESIECGSLTINVASGLTAGTWVALAGVAGTSVLFTGAEL